jgi:uncharacterized alpha-E superfamily protein
MALLSRVAESLFWLGRYVERAENTARILDVTFHARIDPQGMAVAGAQNTWQALIATLGLEGAYLTTHDDFDEHAVIEFLTVSTANPSSIVSALGAARENARSVRDYLSSESWVAINRLYHQTANRSLDLILADGLYDFCDEVRTGVQLFHGTADSTSLHDEGWYWLQTGVFLERADMVTRIIDSKYHLLLESAEEVGGALDRYQWAALLRSVSGYEAFRRTHAAGMEPAAIVEFLILGGEFPRSLRATIDLLVNALDRATQGAEPRLRNPALRRLTDLRNRLQFETVDTLISGGLHEFLEGAQATLGGVNNAVSEAFFWSSASAA